MAVVRISGREAHGTLQTWPNPDGAARRLAANSFPAEQQIDGTPEAPGRGEQPTLAVCKRNNHRSATIWLVLGSSRVSAPETAFGSPCASSGRFGRIFLIIVTVFALILVIVVVVGRSQIDSVEQHAGDVSIDLHQDVARAPQSACLVVWPERITRMIASARGDRTTASVTESVGGVSITT